MKSRLVALVLFALAPSLLLAEDWPQWLGAQRDGVYRESGIVTQIPAGGLPVVWRAPVAHGYAGPAVADGKVYSFEYEITSGELGFQPGKRDTLEGQECVRCLDAASGNEIWKREYDCAYEVSYGGGPRCTPAVDGDRVYTLGAEGDLKCLSTADGAVLWEKSFKNDYGAKTPLWGHSAHPLVVGDTVYCVVGGKDSLAVAFDKMTGQEKWRNLDDREPGYCPATMIEHNGAQQLLIWSPSHLHALRPDSGELIWKLPTTPSYGMSITQPQKQGDRLFISAIGNVSVLLKLLPDGSDVEVLWSGGASDTLRAANVTPIFTADAIYGCDCMTGDLVGLNLADGSRLWSTKKPTVDQRSLPHGTAFLIRAGESDSYYLFSETGELISAKLTPDAYEETGRMQVLEPSSQSFGRAVVWSCPALANKCLFVRNDKELVCLKLSE